MTNQTTADRFKGLEPMPSAPLQVESTLEPAPIVRATTGAHENPDGTWTPASRKPTSIELGPNNSWKLKAIPWDDAQEILHTLSKGKTDTSMDRSFVRVAEKRGRIVLDDTNTPLTWHAIRSLSEFGDDIPFEMLKYLKKKNDLEGLVTYLNRSLDDDKYGNQGKFFLRMKKGPDGGDIIRHVASEKYAKLDNEESAEVIQAALSAFGHENPLVLSLWSNDGDCYRANLLFPKTEVKYPDSNYGVGLAIRNSEIGNYAFGFNPFCYRGFCMNGTIYGKQDLDESTRRRHYGENGIDKEELIDALVVSLGKAIDTGGRMIERQVALKAKKLKARHEQLIAKVAKSFRLSKQEAGSWNKALEQEKGETAFYLLQGLTRAAQDYTGDRRYQMESVAGELLQPAGDSPRNMMSLWESLDNGAENMKEKEVQKYVQLTT